MDLPRLLPLHGNCGHPVKVAEYLPQPYEKCVRQLAVPPFTVTLRIILKAGDKYAQYILDCLIHNLYKAIVNLQRLCYFVVVTEELNFTRAAERLHMVHSLLSYQIRQLEDEPEGRERLQPSVRRACKHVSSREPCRAPPVPTPDILFEWENT